jgi:hypothetical protein
MMVIEGRQFNTSTVKRIIANPNQKLGTAIKSVVKKRRK